MQAQRSLSREEAVWVSDVCMPDRFVSFTSALASRDLLFFGLFRLLGSLLGLGALLEYCVPPRVSGQVGPHAESRDPLSTCPIRNQAITAQPSSRSSELRSVRSVWAGAEDLMPAVRRRSPAGGSAAVAWRLQVAICGQVQTLVNINCGQTKWCLVWHGKKGRG